MRTSISLTAALLLASMAGAQTMMPIPAFSSTYSFATHTRGFYFQAPVDFTIVGLRVPDETSHGLQNVAVIKPPAQPTGATVTGGLQFYRGGVSSTVIVPCNVPFKTGDWVGVLGACGDATIMHNSYGMGSSPVTSSLAGKTVMIHRFCTNTNLVAQQGAGGYWTNVFNIGRVEVYVTSTVLQGAGSGATGTTMSFGLTAPNSVGKPYVMASSLGTGPIPIGMRSIGLSLDDLFAASTSGALPGIFMGYAGTIGASTQASGALNIPSLAALKGIVIHTAFVTFDAAALNGVQEISNTFTFTIN